MPPAAEVRPEKWTDICVLFDDGDYSVVSGSYEGKHCLGERWNKGGNSELGYPNQFGKPLWHVIPDFLTAPVLHGLLDQLAKDPTADGQTYTGEILRAMTEFHRRP